MNQVQPSSAALRDTAARHEVLESDVVFRSGRVIDVRSDLVGMTDGTARRDVVVHPGAVGVIAVNEADEVLLLRQYRHAVRRELWEPPAGLLDVVDEPALHAAKRELYEEAHLEAGRWQVLVDLFTSPGMSDEAVRIFLARQVKESTADRFTAEHEEIDMPARWVEIDAVVTAVLDGSVHNPLLVAGVLALAAARDRGWDSLRQADAPWPESSAFAGSAESVSRDRAQ